MAIIDVYGINKISMVTGGALQFVCVHVDSNNQLTTNLTYLVIDDTEAGLYTKIYDMDVATIEATTGKIIGVDEYTNEDFIILKDKYELDNQESLTVRLEIVKDRNTHIPPP